MKNLAILKRLLNDVKKYPWLCFLTLVCSVISVLSSLFVPILTGKAIDQIISAGNVNFVLLSQMLAYITVATAFSVFFAWCLSFATGKISFKIANRLRADCFEKLSRVPIAYIDGNSHGGIINKITNDTDAISSGLGQLLSQFTTAVFSIIGTIIFMFIVNVYIALAVVFITPLSIFVAWFISKKSHKAFLEQSVQNAQLLGHINEMIANQKLVASFGYFDNSEKQFDIINQKLYVCGQKSQFYSSLSNPCTRFVNSVVYGCVAIFGALFAIRGTFSVGSLVSFLQYTSQYSKPFNEITSVITEIQNSIACAGRVFELIDANEEINEDDLPSLPKSKGRVEFENVCFGYVKEKPLMTALDISVASNQHIAIVGKTGCGKTTLINLIMRFYDTDSGRILIDGNDISHYTKKSLRKQVGMVLQDAWIFSGTIAENIAYGKPTATLDEIKQAGINAGADDFINKMKDGYSSIISESANNLSQGQKQLLCIARIMLTQPQILILDEATSNIDTRTELKIQSAFNKIMKGKTSFIVAHRLSTIISADKILVMRDGNIIEQGSHPDLLAQGGYYKELWDSQFKNVLDDSINQSENFI